MKYLITLILLTFSLCSIAQVELSLQAGIPVQDLTEEVDIVTGFTIAYKQDKPFSVGPFAGYFRFFGDKAGYPNSPAQFENDFGILPIGVKSSYDFGEAVVGIDTAFGIISNVDTRGANGGFYYSPFVGVDFEKYRLEINYQNVKDVDTNFSSLKAGFTFKL